MGLITETKWKQHCGARRYDLGLRRRSQGSCSEWYMRGTVMPNDTSPSREKSYLAKGEHHQEHHRSFAPSSSDGGSQPACVSLVFSGNQATDSFSKWEPFGQECPDMCQTALWSPRSGAEACRGVAVPWYPWAASFLPTENQAIKERKGSFLTASSSQKIILYQDQNVLIPEIFVIFFLKPSEKLEQKPPSPYISDGITKITFVAFFFFWSCLVCRADGGGQVLKCHCKGWCLFSLNEVNRNIQGLGLVFFCLRGGQVWRALSIPHQVV